MSSSPARQGFQYALRFSCGSAEGFIATLKPFSHIFGRGLDDERNAIERFQSATEIEVHPARASGRTKKSKCKEPRQFVSLHAGQRLCPEHSEIIVCV